MELHYCGGFVPLEQTLEKNVILKIMNPESCFYDGEGTVRPPSLPKGSIMTKVKDKCSIQLLSIFPLILKTQ